MRHHSTITLLICLAFTGGAMAAQPGELGGPVDLTGVGVIERQGDLMPLDLAFNDEHGRPVVLRELLMKDKPVVLNLGYFTCPSICNIVMNGMTDVMKATSLLPGRDYVVISLSIDPGEESKVALAKKSNYLRVLGHAEAGKGWHFLTGGETNIRAIADAAGYEYKWMEEAREYAHPAVLVILTPDGRVSRYLHGSEFAEDTFRLSLVEASAGKIGSFMDQLMLICFGYDKDKHKYTLAAVNLMKIGGVLTIITLTVVAVLLFRRDRLIRRAAPDDMAPSIGHTST